MNYNQNFPLPIYHSAPLKDTKDLLIANFSIHFSIFVLIVLSATIYKTYHSLLPEMYYLSGFHHPILLFLFYMSCHFVFFLVSLYLLNKPQQILCGSPCKIKTWGLLVKN